MATTGLITSATSAAHDTGMGHPECPARLVAIAERLASAGLAAELDAARATPAPLAALAGVHAAPYVDRVRAEVEAGARWIDTPDVPVGDASYRAALDAAGGALDAVNGVLAGRWKNAFVCVRPPGHHAEEGLAMGFCLFNNVAVAARHVLSAYGSEDMPGGGLERVAIVDWDVHHGNGTQHLFERDPAVFYASLHQHPHYPGTGLASERGRGAGEGATLNCPQPAGSGDAEWLGAFEASVLPALEAFDPQFVLVSAGFDAHARDPLSSTLLTKDAYARMTELLTGFARERCGGRLVSLLEGGYDLEGLAESVEAHVAGLVGA